MPLNILLKSESRCPGWLASIAVCLFSVTGSLVPADGGTIGSQSLDIAALIEDVNVALGLEASTVVSLDAGQTAGAGSGIAVPIDGELYTLDLQPHSVRADTYQVIIQAADGTYQNVEPGQARTLRGTVAQIDGSAVAASMVDGGLRARIILPDGVNYWIEPVGSRVASAGPNDHAVYREDDVIPDGGTCMALHPPIGLTANEGETGSVAAAGLAIAEIAIDADYDYYLDFQWDDDPVAATEARINEVINAINVQYERDVGIRHVITKIIIRTAEPDPYDDAVTDAGDLLTTFKLHWLSAHGNINRDIAQLFTGKNLDGGTIGVAWVGVICNSDWGYSVVESNCCSNFACKTDLSAHELGHNWDAIHCSCPGWTMNPTIQCANRFHETYTIPDIIDHRNTRTCLDEGDELRRVIVSADSSTVLTDDTLQFTAIADFRYGDDLDITSEATWSIDRPEAGTVDSDGLFTTALDINGDICATVSATHSSDGITRTGEQTVAVLDADAPLAVVQSVPPDGTIDARQPSEPDGTSAAGWQAVDITLSGDTCLVTTGDFVVEQEGGNLPAPSIVGLEQSSARTLRMSLSRPIEPGTWTTMTHIDSGISTRIGFLPGDVNGDQTASPADILALVDALNGVGDPLPIWSTDVDRSGHAGPPDILRVIDLLNGAGVFDAWNNRRLP